MAYSALVKLHIRYSEIIYGGTSAGNLKQILIFTFPVLHIKEIILHSEILSFHTGKITPSYNT